MTTQETDHRDGADSPERPSTMEPDQPRSRTADRLQWAGTRAQQALREERRARTDKDRVHILLPAANEVLDAVSDLLINDGVWQAATAAEAATRALGDGHLLSLQQVLDQDLAALLTYLGYRPPPPAHRMEEDLRAAIDWAIASTRTSDVNSALTARAKQDLFVFAYRLREVTKDAKRHLGGSNDVGDERRLRISAQDLRVVVKTAVRAAGPAAIAAAAVALIYPPAAAALGLHAATEASKEAIKQLVELGSLGLLTRVLAPDVASASCVAVLSGAAAGTAALVVDLATTLEDLQSDDTYDRARQVETGCIAAISAAYSVLQSAALTSEPVDAIEGACRRIIELAQYLRGVDGVAAIHDETAAVALDLRAQAGRLRAIAEGAHAIPDGTSGSPRRPRGARPTRSSAERQK